MTTNPTTCPGCQHPQHAPGDECETGVQHGPKRWHRCLCLNQSGASRPCPPQMDCQGGTLGYSDIWNLRQGRNLIGVNGETITPDVLAEEPAAVQPLADRAALRDRIADALVTTSRAEWPYTPGQEKWDHHKHGDRPGHSYSISCALCTGDVERLAEAVLAVLPELADRAAAECSAQNHNYESGPRLCIRAAQHRGDHIDKRGFHWSDTVAVYPVGDGTFLRGTDVRTELRRLAGEEQSATRRCPSCGHQICDGDGPCGALMHVMVTSEKRCACTGPGANEAQQDGAQS